MLSPSPNATNGDMSVTRREARVTGFDCGAGRQGDSDTSIIDFLARHPGSTVGDLARGLNFSPVTVSSPLTQLANSGEIKKVSHGYNTKQATRPRSR
jgi:hypothetical protein